MKWDAAWIEALRANRHGAAATDTYQPCSAALASMARFAASGDWAMPTREGNSKPCAGSTVSQASFALMTRNGYRRLHPERSRMDDWYGLAA